MKFLFSLEAENSVSEIHGSQFIYENLNVRVFKSAIEDKKCYGFSIQNELKYHSLDICRFPGTKGF